MGVNILCLGRQHLEQEKFREEYGCNTLYVFADMNNLDNVESVLSEKILEFGGDCVFFNFAWHGRHSLTDGELSDQMNNVHLAANAVKFSKKIGCRKFVNVGSMEETLIEEALRKNELHSSNQENYGLAKIASRDLCKITSYIEKIDYIHTRLSVPLSTELEGGYVASTLKSIKAKENYEMPRNQGLFDIISLDEVAVAYFLIGKHGRNTSDYFIGSSRPVTLKRFFQAAEVMFSESFSEDMFSEGIAEEMFNTKKLEEDCGFVPPKSSFEVLKAI